MIPLFLWAASLISPFLTQTSKAMGVFPAGLGKNEMFSAVDSDPLEKMLAMLIGNAVRTLDLKTIGLALLALLAYIALFAWYIRRLRREAAAGISVGSVGVDQLDAAPGAGSDSAQSGVAAAEESSSPSLPPVGKRSGEPEEAGVGGDASGL